MMNSNQMAEKEVFQVIKSFFDVERTGRINVNVITSGLINATFKITLENGGQFILQKINNIVFKRPWEIQENIARISEYLIAKNYEKQVLIPVKTLLKKSLYSTEDGSAWRLFNFIGNTDCHSIVLSEDHAFEAAKSLGQFHSILSDFNAKNLYNPIPGFLDFKARKDQFKAALIHGDHNRIKASSKEVARIEKHAGLLDNYQAILPKLPVRVIHADPKISNFLFKRDSAHIAGIIDLDTLMQGSVLYDFGDMVRSFTNLKEEDDCSNSPTFNDFFYNAILRGYLVHQKGRLMDIEEDNLLLGAKVVIYIQAVRFLTDFLLNDLYYKTAYPEQNRNRAVNQINLLEEMIAWKD